MIEMCLSDCYEWMILLMHELQKGKINIQKEWRKVTKPLIFINANNIPVPNTK
jgi:hypothetical protein